MDAIDIKGDTELLDLLSSAPAAELGLLVDHLTDLGKGRLALPAAVKELLLESRQRSLYTEATLRLLISELQQFGGNTVANLTRRSGVPYREIVLSAIAYVGEKGDVATSVESLELHLVAAYLERAWPNIGESERAALYRLAKLDTAAAALADVRAAVLAGGAAATAAALLLSKGNYPLPKKPVDALKVAGKVGLTFALPLPGLASAVNDLAGAAFRVTVPCVIHIAYLRQARLAAQPHCPGCGVRLGSQARFCGACGQSLSPSSGMAVHAASGERQTTHLLHIGHSPDAPLLSIAEMDGSALRGKPQALNLGADIDRLSPLLQALPAQIVAGEVGSHRYLKVVVNGSLAQAADGNGLRGFTRGPDNKFVEHARFFEDDRLQNLVNGAALFQIASVIVAQKHLADISRKLSEILEGIGRIEAFQQNERKAAIDAAVEYLQDVAPLIIHGELMPTVHSQLESHEVRLGETQKHLHKDIENLIAEVAVLKDPDNFGTAGLTQALRLRQERFEDLVTQWKTCLAARFMACRLNACFPETRSLAEQRRHSLDQIGAALFGQDGWLFKFTDAVTNRSSGFKAMTDKTATVQANRARLSLWDQSRRPTLESVDHVSFQHLDQLVLENNEPVAMVLELRDGQVLRALAAA